MFARYVGLIFALVAIFALFSCRAEDVRYRVTVEVDTPQGLRSGSAVWQVRTSKGITLPGPEAGGIHMQSRAEAVTVDLPTGKLFLLAGAPGGVVYSERLMQALVRRYISAHPDTSPQRNGRDWRADWQGARQSRASIALEPDEYPALVTFTNPADPLSAQMVDPVNLAATFGPGVSLRRITVTVTDDAPTETIVDILPWLPRFAQGGRFSGTHQRDLQHPERNLSYSDFIYGN
jgi:hypothetical protein